ncbi:MAG TPA: RNA 2'-phosphotransferase [Polyangiaceae bacterium]|nr:RNA 2'-phosphotransferase [Polyangiaceae bacterium]
MTRPERTPDVAISRALSHALRHEPWLYELELDEEGWANLDVVLAALRQHRDEWRELSRQDIERVVATSAKRRYEIGGERIRALYGHSVPGALRRVAGVPPEMLFHGTSPLASEAILRDGLKPMSRQNVHLSVDVATALEVGRRKSRAPVLLHVEARAAHDGGVAFYVGNEKVWLADAVPAEFVRLRSPA